MTLDPDLAAARAEIMRPAETLPKPGPVLEQERDRRETGVVGSAPCIRASTLQADRLTSGCSSEPKPLATRSRPLPGRSQRVQVNRDDPMQRYHERRRLTRDYGVGGTRRMQPQPSRDHEPVTDAKQEAVGSGSRKPQRSATVTLAASAGATPHCFQGYLPATG